MQLELFPKIDLPLLTEQIFAAYFECRKNKRNTINALKFEKHLEANLFELIDEIYEGGYNPGRSIAFIVNKPVKREIFAADFRDRVVHHWLIQRLNPLFEQLFIDDSYACRAGRGTHFGIRRVDSFIKACSENYSKDCYILKLDIQGFFMHIDRRILFEKLFRFICANYKAPDIGLVIEMSRKIIFNNPAERCLIKGSMKDWEGLPKNKSLFHSPQNCGLPIGNLTSQVFANFYLHQLDHFLKTVSGIEYYGRYVDDFILVHPDKKMLISIVPVIEEKLKSALHLRLHPAKIYFQHYAKGVKFLGVFIKPYRILIARRTKGNFYAAIQKHNRIVSLKIPGTEEKSCFLSCMNSYLGILRHYKTRSLRKKLIDQVLSARWLKYCESNSDLKKFVLIPLY